MRFELLPVPDESEPAFPDPQDTTRDYNGEDPFFDDYFFDDFDDTDIDEDFDFYNGGAYYPEASDNPDDNPYGMVYDQRGKRVATTTHEVLSDAAYEIGDTMSWQLLGIRGNVDQDVFMADVLSKGPVPDIVADDFGDITECVTVNPEPTEATRKIHALTFNGNRAELDDFIVYLRDKYAYPVGEGENPLDGVPLPALLFASVVSRGKQANS
jgi:hypothetical protein